MFYLFFIGLAMDIMMTMMAMAIIMEVGITMGTETTSMMGVGAMMTTNMMATVNMMSMGMVTATMDTDTSAGGWRVTTATRMSINMAT